MSALLDAGAFVDKQDRNQWSALMWAMTNRHKTIAKILLDHGASPDIKSSSGGTAFDFAQPGSEISEYLHENGYNFGPGAVEDDFYDSGFGHSRFEEEMAENEMKRRMMMEESAINLEVDLSSLGLDEKLDVSFAAGGEGIVVLICSSRLTMASSRRNSRSSFGISVSTTRCSSSRRTSWRGY